MQNRAKRTYANDNLFSYNPVGTSANDRRSTFFGGFGHNAYLNPLLNNNGSLPNNSRKVLEKDVMIDYTNFKSKKSIVRSSSTHFHSDYNISNSNQPSNRQVIHFQKRVKTSQQTRANKRGGQKVGYNNLNYNKKKPDNILSISIEGNNVNPPVT
jgi:hypothetical protein